MSPRLLFRRVAVAEALTWAGLLTGMVLKYGTGTTDLGVRVFGMLHGVVFLGYCLVTVLVAIDQRWRPGRLLLGLTAAVPPFATLAFERYAGSRAALGETWRLGDAGQHSGQDHPRGTADRAVAWLVRNPARGAATGLVAVLVLTGVALAAGPPGG